jgi:hypothetical protein
MLYEIAWKAVWMLGIALPAWMTDKWTAGIASVFTDCVGILIALFIVPWNYVWARYIRQPMEPLMRAA